MTSPTARRATTPQEMHSVFKELLDARDLDGLLTLYEETAAMLNGAGQVASGLAAIRESLAPFVGMEANITFQPAEVVQAGDIALVHAKWSATGKTPDGPIEMAGVTSEIVRRQPDGRWLYVVDDPGVGATAP
ncbi:MAG: nuclear transport factor 2 family protein [Dehalococcoidia bacterium]